MSTGLSLGDYIQDRTESLDEDSINKFFVVRNSTYINRLLDTEQYLIEGSRGVGKTMLMKAALLESRKVYNKNSVLTVWVSFEESIRLERIKVESKTVDPFLQWTMGKTLLEFLKELKIVTPGNSEALNKRLASMFNITPFDIGLSIKNLTTYIEVLEKGEVGTSKDLEGSAPTKEISAILDNPSSFKQYIEKICADCNINRVVFLFDEAAHMFSFSQQELFFDFFKVLRSPKISCKAAVYPGVTNYGKNFEKGQDAKDLRLTWSPREASDREYIKDILKIRLQKFDVNYWARLTANPSVIETIAVCSNGNPRFAFHIIDALEEEGGLDKNVNLVTVINAIRKVFENKWKQFGTLKKRLVKYHKYITYAEKFVRVLASPTLIEWNTKRRGKGEPLASGVYIESNLFSKMPHLFEVLSYSSIADVDYSKKSIGHGKHGYFLDFNPALLISDIILKDSIEVVKTSISTDNCPAFTEKNDFFSDSDSLSFENEYKCSDSTCTFKTIDSSFQFCPKCGNKMAVPEEPAALYKILREYPIEELKLTDFLISKCKTKYKTIGELYDSTIEELKTIQMIGDVRANKLLNAAIEYMAG